MMENEINSIDKKIEQLKIVMLQRYNDQISKINRDIVTAQEAAIESVVLNRAGLIKELDDRLALIKEFPSVLEADVVAIKEISSVNQSINIEFRNGRFRI